MAVCATGENVEAVLSAGKKLASEQCACLTTLTTFAYDRMLAAVLLLVLTLLISNLMTFSMFLKSFFTFSKSHIKLK